jgi:hypothetical protein
MNIGLSKIVVSPEGEQLYTFEHAALLSETSVTLVQFYIGLGVIESIGSMLHPREITRIAQIQLI